MTDFNTLCGKCLHSKQSHTPHNGHFQYCATCSKLCDSEEFNTDLKPSGISISDKTVFIH